MNFLNPFVLFGLAAAAIPILLHLLNLRKTQTVEFSTLYFLKELKKSTIRTIKIKQWILLLLRTLLILFAVLAFSQPIYNGSLPLLSSMQSNKSIIVVVDNTSSMLHSTNAGSLLSQVKNEVRSLIEELSENDELCIMPIVTTSNYRFSSNKQQLLEEVSSLNVTIASATIPDVVQKIIALIPSAKHSANLALFVLSDNQTTQFESLLQDSIQFQLPLPTMFYKSYTPSNFADEPNCSVDTIQFKTTMFRSGKPIELDVKVRNTSTKEVTTTVFCQFGTSIVGQQQITIAPNSSLRVPFSVLSSDNGIVAVKAFVENDSYEADNSFYSSLRLNGKPNVVLIGSPSKTNFVQKALQLPGSVLTNVTAITASEIGNQSFSGVQTVFIVDQLSQIQPTFISQLSEKGIGVFLFADEQEDKIVPFIQHIGGSGVNEQNGTPSLQFTSTDRRHPIFQGVFKDDTKGMIESPNIATAFPSQGGIPIIEMQGGSFLSEFRFGQSTIFYCAVPVSIKQSNFPLLSLFPVLLNRSVSYLSQSEGIGALKEGGIPITLEISKSYQESALTLTDPNGLVSSVMPYSLPSKTAIQIPPQWNVGTYSVKTKENVPITSLAVNIPQMERDLINENNEKTLSIFKQLFPKVTTESIQTSKLYTKSLSKTHTRTELWQFFLTLAILCAFIELIVASQFKEVTES
jgi:hypothetical protein